MKLIAKFLVNYFFLNLIAIILALSLHEIGHALIASAFGCKAKAVIYDSSSNFPYTEVACTKLNPLIYLSGFLFTILASILLLLSEEDALKNLGLIILGLSFSLSSADFQIIFGGLFSHLFFVLSFPSIFFTEIFVVENLINTITNHFKNV